MTYFKYFHAVGNAVRAGHVQRWADDVAGIVDICT